MKIYKHKIERDAYCRYADNISGHEIERGTETIRIDGMYINGGWPKIHLCLDCAAKVWGELGVLLELP